jgi:hypothetical protein
VCEAPDCDRKVYARKLCERHYRQLLRRGRLRADPVPAECAVDGCARRAVTRGWCHGHYLRWSRTGDVRPDLPLARRKVSDCQIDGCSAVTHGHGLCRTHLRRLEVLGTPAPEQPVRSPGDAGWITVCVPADLRHLSGGAPHMLEHRFVMAVILDRPLRPGESVHHRNGDRLDNRPENLELWSKRQPAGQRVADKLAFAYELIADYDRETGAALGLDLDPDTGAPYDQPPAHAV